MLWLKKYFDKQADILYTSTLDVFNQDKQFVYGYIDKYKYIVTIMYLICGGILGSMAEPSLIRTLLVLGLSVYYVYTLFVLVYTHQYLDRTYPNVFPKKKSTDEKGDV